MDKRLLLQMTADIVSAHASMNELSQTDLLSGIDQVFKKLSDLGGGDFEAEEEAGAAEAVQAAAEVRPAVPLEAAFGSQKVFCMVCGKGMKTLKRHISTAHGMKPGQYRKTFGISAGTPLVAKDYSEARKTMAKDLNLAERLVKARAARSRKKKG
ncbi:MAG: MucR family transcriptional regulator [Deltaproteobacteria bacterium]|nr:MucR family transcriptional regulator [Deltaproteobacteria bacterium]